MVESPILEIDPAVPDGPFGADYEASIRPEVHEYYGAKINMFYSDREVRVAFGHAYGHERGGDEMHIEPRYQVAIFMPVKTARELAMQLTHGLALIDAAEAAEAKPDVA